MNRRQPHNKPEARPVNKKQALATRRMPEIKVTLPTSGMEATLRLPKVSLGLVLNQIRKKFPRPTPPKQIVALMGKDTLVENTADPDYEERVSEWEGQVVMAQMEAQLKLMLVNLPTDAELEQVKHLRYTVGSLLGFESSDDYDIWLNFILIQSDDDQITLVKAMTSLLNPSDEEVDEETETFPS